MDSRIRGILLETVGKKPGLRRKQVLERCVRELGYANRPGEASPDSEIIHVKSRVGLELTALIQKGDILEDESGRMTRPGTMTRLAARDQAESLVLKELESGRKTKRELFQAADRLPGMTDSHSVTGEAIASLLREKRIRELEDGYALPPSTGFPNTEMGYWLAQARDGRDLQECFLSAVHIRGGEWFESYAVQLLSAYYRTVSGKTVLRAGVTGGSADGGIDGILETADALGFREKTLLQMKNRRVQMTAKDVREFYGAVCAENGSRGVFITISTFHREAWSLINKVDNLTGIDGARLFELAKACEKGLKRTPNGYALDEAMFLE